MSNKAEVAVSYDVSNEFFRLWLDERMNYTCAVFDGTDSLEQAQLNKLAVLHDYAHVTKDSVVLDIGCGWGANLEYLAVNRGVRQAHGITLSEAQHTEIRRRNLPNVVSHCVSYLDYKPEVKFDAVESICMIEHVCAPEDARANRQVEMYRNYFHLAHQWTKPGAHFALQTILRNRIPRNRKDLQDVGHATYKIFPGGITPRLEDIIQAVNPYWEVKEINTRRVDYQKTCDHWRTRLRRNEALIRQKWGNEVFDDYDRYLSTCVRAFDQHYQSLAQYSLKRIDDAW
jgi:cyclopropane-fatty-acyl-phospholipid synthase